MTPREAAALLAAKPETTILLDVREPMELDIAAVRGVLHIPMGEIPERLAEIDGSKTIVCLCRSGARSGQVATFLAAQGYPAVFNLEGGILAWSEEVDDSIPKY